MSDTDEASKRRYLAEVDKVLLYLRTLFGPWTDEVDPNVMITGEGGRAASAAGAHWQSGTTENAVCCLLSVGRIFLRQSRAGTAAVAA